MTEERCEWFRVASHLKIPVSELKTRITFSEFVDWLIYLERESIKELKQELYQAQIAAEVRRSMVLHPEKVNRDDFLIKLAKPEDPETKKKKEGSKRVWAGILNVKLEDN